MGEVSDPVAWVRQRAAEIRAGKGLAELGPQAGELTNRLNMLESQIADLSQLTDAVVQSEPVGLAQRLDAIYETLEEMCAIAGVPPARPARRHLRLVRPDEAS